ncbi:MAG: hypothetical protein HKO59_07255 [Phycisphaerales bacterium]|nr:hypothetical protein [Phycisphaerae bacterium]NNM25772.1 hypothetical protein [Phycisphaerales bacterium]
MRTGSILATGLALATLLGGCAPGDDGTAPPPTTTPPGTTSDATPKKIQLPRHWFDGELDHWVGQEWQSLDLLQYVQPPPSGLDDELKYLVFYGRNCDHCRDMFNDDLAPNPDLAARVTAVEVPVGQKQLRDPNPWPMPDTACELRQLPLGPHWIMTTPLTIRLENGVVQCVEESGHEECMLLE